MNTLAKLVDKFFNKLRSDEISPSQCANSDIPCLLKAVNRFLKYGDKSDAFTVYFCFSEIFNLFGNGYSNTQKLLELLADHEYHSGELLSKHRDHYSHSPAFGEAGNVLSRYARTWCAVGGRPDETDSHMERQ